MNLEAQILIVDDNDDNRYTLSNRLRRQGYVNLGEATNGREALECLESGTFDLVLLDIAMPELDGYGVLEHLKRHPNLCHVPVIMISAMSELDNVVRCIELGAEDYLPKPFNPILLKARVSASLERKAMHDREVAQLAAIERERQRANELLHAMLPASAVSELQTHNYLKARRFDNVTVMFGDVIGFTAYCEAHDAEQVVSHLDLLASALEDIAERNGLEKIKTVGDAFMTTANLLEAHDDPVMASVCSAFEMAAAARQNPARWNVRVGIHTGPVVAGMVGRSKFSFDLWGDTVNIAARLASFGTESVVYLTDPAWKHVADRCAGECLGLIDVRGRSPVTVYKCHSSAGTNSCSSD